MSDEIATDATPEASEGSAEAQPDDPQEAADEATWKKRLAGTQSALSRTQLERDAARTDLAEVQRKLAEYEQANLSEVEKLQRQVAQFQAERDKATAEATRLRLKSEYPLAFTTLGDAAPLDESVLPDIEKRLAELRGEPDEPRVDPNNPRRPTSGPKPVSEMTGDELEAHFKTIPNPFAAESGFGG